MSSGADSAPVFGHFQCDITACATWTANPLPIRGKMFSQIPFEAFVFRFADNYEILTRKTSR